MPTYTNTGVRSIAVEEAIDGTEYVYPGSTVQTYIYHTNTDLNLDSDDPVYTPLISEDLLSSSGVGDDKTVLTNEETTYITIYDVQGSDIGVYNYDKTNKLITISNGSSWSWGSNKRTRQLILEFPNAGSCTLIQSREEVIAPTT